MNKAFRFIRLDFITVMPYFTLKNLLIFLAVPLIFIISSGTSTASIGMLMAFSVLYVSYPFAICEKNSIDALYATLSIKRNTVVLGRYLFALTFDLAAGILAYMYSFTALTIMQKELNTFELLATVVVLFIVFSIIQAVQLPIYFKLGYAKAKMLAYMPFIAFALVTVAINNLSGSAFMRQITACLEWVIVHPFVSSALGVIVWLGIMIISYQISVSYYRKRDF